MMKNFTVIGNMLFCHIVINKKEPSQNVVEVPFEIYRRLTSYSNVFFTSNNVLQSRTASSIYMGIRLVNGIPFMFYGGTIDWKQIHCLYAIYLLKDI